MKITETNRAIELAKRMGPQAELKYLGQMLTATMPGDLTRLMAISKRLEQIIANFMFMGTQGVKTSVSEATDDEYRRRLLEKYSPMQVGGDSLNEEGDFETPDATATKEEFYDPPEEDEPEILDREG